MIIVVPILISLVVGSYFGWHLAKRGVTADNALQHHQRHVYQIGSVALGIGTLLFILLMAGKQTPWVPSFLLLYVGAYNWMIVVGVCCFCIGLFVWLELPGWRDKQRLQQLLLFLVVSISATTFLVYQRLPITPLLQSSRVLDEIVLQTTPYSCAAATIATLDRLIYPERQTTERDVVELAQTNRQGTSTLAEINVMKQLGLAPQYVRNLTIEDLINRQQLAVLHVMEPVGGTRIQHAIALLAIDPEKRIMTVANPLYGKQVKQFDEMPNYWIGESIFVTALPDR